MTAEALMQAPDTVVRARLLSVGFAPPTEDRLELLGRLADALGEGLVTMALCESDLMTLAGEYERLFGPAGLCPPYEGLYEPDPFRETRELADIAGFYAAFGAEASGPARERPDHVGCELEFLAFLALRRATSDGGDPAAETAKAAEDAFLESHLGRWLPRFCADVQEVTREPLYASLAGVGSRFCERELLERALEVEFMGPRRRRGGEGTPDELACGVAAPTRLLQIHGRAFD